MRITFLSLAIVSAFALLSFRAAAPLPIGSSLPMGDQEVTGVSGNKFTVKSSAKKNGLLVMFSCNTCPYVVKNQQRTGGICNYAKKMDVGVIVLNSNAGNRNGADSYDAMKLYAKQQQYSWEYGLDENNQLADAFGATRTPECFLFDKEFKLVYHGAIDNNPGDEASVSRRHLQVAIDEMVEGKEVAVKQTKSVGCGIKRI